MGALWQVTISDKDRSLKVLRHDILELTKSNALLLQRVLSSFI